MPTYVNIHVIGQLDPSWSVWFDQFTLKYDKYGDTILSGIITGRDEWISLLGTVYGNNLKLLSIYPDDPWLVKSEDLEFSPNSGDER
jgi:hypothetical protein